MTKLRAAVAFFFARAQWLVRGGATGGQTAVPHAATRLCAQPRNLVKAAQNPHDWLELECSYLSAVIFLQRCAPCPCASAAGCVSAGRPCFQSRARAAWLSAELKKHTGFNNSIMNYPNA